MAIRALVHVQHDETILCEIDEIPKPTDNFIVLRYPRKRDGKPIETLADGATTFIFPWTKVAFIELFEELTQRENVVGLFRESDGNRRRG